MSSNPVPGAKEYLLSLFDDNRKKVCHFVHMCEIEVNCILKEHLFASCCQYLINKHLKTNKAYCHFGQ